MKVLLSYFVLLAVLTRRCRHARLMLLPVLPECATLVIAAPQPC